MSHWGLRSLKLFVLIGVPVLGFVYSYQFTNSVTTRAIPFRTFQAPPSQALQVAKNSEVPTSLQSLDWQKNTLTVVNFWATWCPPCVEEFPAMVELQRKVEPFGVKLLFVSVDDSWDKVKSFLKEYRIDIPEDQLLWDPKKSLAEDWGSDKFPETYVVRRDGWVVEKIIGAQHWARPQSVNYFVKLAKNEKTTPQRDYSAFWIPAANATEANKPRAESDLILHEQDKVALDRLKENIEKANKNLQNAEAALREENRNQKELNAIEKRQEEDLKLLQKDARQVEDQVRQLTDQQRKAKVSFESETLEKARLLKEVEQLKIRIQKMEQDLEEERQKLTQGNKAVNTRTAQVETLEKTLDSFAEELEQLKVKEKQAQKLVEDKNSELQTTRRDSGQRRRNAEKLKVEVEKAESVLNEQKSRLSKFESILRK